MGVGLSTIQRWVSQYRKEQRGFTPSATAITLEQQGIQALEKQVKQLQSDNQLPNKASVDSSEQRQQIAVKLKKAGNKVQQICRCLSLAPSMFYYRAKPQFINVEKVKLDAAIKQVHHDMDATYGKRRMLVELQSMGFDIGIHRVRTAMRRL